MEIKKFNIKDLEGHETYTKEEVINLLDDIWGQIEKDAYELEDYSKKYVEMRDINYWFKDYIKAVKEEQI